MEDKTFMIPPIDYSNLNNIKVWAYVYNASFKR